MTTQTIQIQTGALLGRLGQVEGRRFANFIETIKKLIGARFNTSHTTIIEYGPNTPLKAKNEVDAYFAGVGLV